MKRLEIDWDFGLIVFMQFVTPSCLLFSLSEHILDRIELLALSSVKILVGADRLFGEIESLVSGVF